MMNNIGVLYGDILEWKQRPFKKERLNESFLKLSKIASENDIRVLISSFSLCFDGIVKKAWTYDEDVKDWVIVKNIKLDLIYDRFRSNELNDQIKNNVKDGVRIFNHLKLNDLCWDKFSTYMNFPEFVPRCFPINSSKEFKKIKHMIRTQKIVLKPRYGIMGYGIEFKNKHDKLRIKQNTVVQEFIDSSEGIRSLGIKGVHDLRVVLINGKIDHCYMRVAGDGELKTNCSLGAKKIFISKNKIPKEAIEITKTVDLYLERFGERIYTVDFAFDRKQRPFIIELESIPGFAYYDGAEAVQTRFLKNIIKVLNDVVKSEKRIVIPSYIHSRTSQEVLNY